MATRRAINLDGLGRRLVGIGPRAIWLRLFPMRAIWRVRSRSTARADAVQVRVRAIASRSSADGDTPAAAAFSRQTACSAGVTRAATITVRCSATVAPETGLGGLAPTRPLLRQRRDRPGVRRGVQQPLASRDVQHRVCWLPANIRVGSQSGGCRRSS